MDLIDLYEEYREDPAFEHLRGEHIKLVPGRGNERPSVMILGEAPGAQENLHGEPFVGRSGHLLDQLMREAGLYADDQWRYPMDSDDDPPEVAIYANTFITNTVKYRPPANRTPSRREIEASRPWILKEWKILGKPKVIITTGAVPLACIKPELLPVSDAAGRPFVLKPSTLTLWPMFHPAFALRNKPMRPVVERHWQDLGEWLQGEGIT